MAIKRYYATKDSTITNAFKQNLSTRATGSNMGAADILEVFSIYAQSNSGSAEEARVLIQFPVSGTAAGEIKGDRDNEDIPASGSVRFYLKLFNAKHAQTLPRDLTLSVLAVSQSWSEGTGLDMENYTDLGVVNWVSASVSGTVLVNSSSQNAVWDGAWGTSSLDAPADGDQYGYIPGGTYHTAAYVAGVDSMPHYSANFPEGDEDLEVDITAAVEEWIAGTYENYGFGVHLTSTQQPYSVDGFENVPVNAEGATRSYYTKKFFSRTSEFFFKRPYIEARWDSSRKDNRGNFLLSSSLAPAGTNLNTLYLYNYINGTLQDIPGLEDASGKRIFVSLFSGSVGGFYEGGDGDDVAPSNIPVSGSTGSVQILSEDNDGNVADTNLLVVTGGIVSTGIYSASVAFTGGQVPGTGTLVNVYDVWFTGSSDGSTTSAFDAAVQYYTGTITPRTLKASSDYPTEEFVSNIANLKASYTITEKPRFRLYVRDRNWSPNIYTVSQEKPQTTIIEDAYYQISRAIDNLVVVPYGTGSNKATRLSYDVSGNYFDFEMKNLEKDYMYNINFVYYLNGDYQEQPETFKFRIEEES